MSQLQDPEDIQRRIDELKRELSKSSRSFETAGTIAGLAGIAGALLLAPLAGGLFLAAGGVGTAATVLGKKLSTENELKAKIHKLEERLAELNRQPDT